MPTQMHNSFGCFKQQRGKQARADDEKKQKSKRAVLCLRSKPMKFNVRHHKMGVVVDRNERHKGFR